MWPVMLRKCDIIGSLIKLGLLYIIKIFGDYRAPSWKENSSWQMAEGQTDPHLVIFRINAKYKYRYLR